MPHIVFVEVSKPGINAIRHAKRKGHRVTWLRSDTFNWVMPEADRQVVRELVDETITIDDARSAESVQAGLAQCLVKGLVDAVIPILHYCVLPTAQAARDLGLRCTGLNGVLNARNKKLTRQILGAHGMRSASYRVAHSHDTANEAARALGFPVVVKPVTGLGKMMLEIVEDQCQLDAYFADWALRLEAFDPVIQREITHEFVIERIEDGPMFSTEFAVTASGRHVPLITLRRKRGRHNQVLEIGSTVPSGLSPDETRFYDEYLEKVVRALDLKVGIFHAEVIYRKDGPMLIEVNPRIAGGGIPDLILAATAVDPFELLVDVFVDEDPPLAPLEIKTCASQTLIAAKDDCVLRDTLPTDWFEPFKARAYQGAVNIKAGQRLDAMTSNYGSVGFVRVRAHSREAAEGATARLMTDIEETLGVPLVSATD